MFRFTLQIGKHFLCVKYQLFTISHDLFIFEKLPTLVFNFGATHKVLNTSNLLNPKLSNLYVDLSHESRVPHFESVVQLLLYLLNYRIELCNEIKRIVKIKCTSVL